MGQSPYFHVPFPPYLSRLTASITLPPQEDGLTQSKWPFAAL
ncbi:hypothetical protein HMPREF9412_2078 [Paenibacillus sp. HGF5]|nr:hypothetical protein HMPREF9412_2078 [Paenibacillus sp. HGF5]